MAAINFTIKCESLAELMAVREALEIKNDLLKGEVRLMDNSKALAQSEYMKMSDEQKKQLGQEMDTVQRVLRAIG